MEPITGSSLLRYALETLPYEPLEEQMRLLRAVCEFACSGGPREVFVINGYAGTGKTSLTGALVRALQKTHKKFVILAPTGRAAKVASAFSGAPASTIHKRLYRGNSTDPGNTTFFIAPNNDRDTLFIVDEASLIADNSGLPDRSLLWQLIRHVYSAPGCRMVLIGDSAQLPPVGQTRAMALSKDRLRALGLEPISFTLDIPVRQAADSGIVYNATHIRECMRRGTVSDLVIYEKGFADVKVISSADLAEYLADSRSLAGEDECLIVTRSNYRANKFNRAIRQLVMYAEEPLQRGDRILISKNDYYWSRQNKMTTFLANGDMAEVMWVGKTEKAHGRYFVDVELRLAGSELPVAAKVMLRSLVCDGPAIDRMEMQRFYNVVLSSYEGELSHKLKGVAEDPYYNALQVKYAYCVTCHKAQGGQWRHVYIDMSGINPKEGGEDFLRWYYTAITRATERVYLINPPLSVK